MVNIFENAYFGKAYKTRDGRKAIYLRNFICNGIYHFVSTGDIEFTVNDKGNVDKIYQFGADIVSEWKESIDDEKLDELANEDFENDKFTNIPQIETYYKIGFKVGYRKAKEEQL